MHEFELQIGHKVLGTQSCVLTTSHALRSVKVLHAYCEVADAGCDVQQLQCETETQNTDQQI